MGGRREMGSYGAIYTIRYYVVEGDGTVYNGIIAWLSLILPRGSLRYGIYRMVTRG